MNIEFTGRHTVVSHKLKEQAEASLAAITRITNRCTNAHVILTEDKYRMIAEVSLQCRGDVLVATAEAATMESALHDALAKVEQQAIRNKEKFATVRDHAQPIAAAVSTI
jgi:putative sigma-54 modulation protein